MKKLLLFIAFFPLHSLFSMKDDPFDGEPLLWGLKPFKQIKQAAVSVNEITKNCEKIEKDYIQHLNKLLSNYVFGKKILPKYPQYQELILGIEALENCMPIEFAQEFIERALAKPIIIPISQNKNYLYTIPLAHYALGIFYFLGQKPKDALEQFKKTHALASQQYYIEYAVLKDEIEAKTVSLQNLCKLEYEAAFRIHMLTKKPLQRIVYTAGKKLPISKRSKIC